jgi:hypothetical protein
MASHFHWISASDINFHPESPSRIDLVQSGVVKPEELEDALRQFDYFISNWHWIRTEFAGKYVIVCAGRLFNGNDYREARERCRSTETRPYFAAGFIPDIQGS